jgi:hypothetical protein
MQSPPVGNLPSGPVVKAVVPVEDAPSVMRYPPGFEPPGPKPKADAQPVRSAPATSPRDDKANFYPPASPRKAAPAKSESKPTPPADDARYPPGFKPRGEQSPAPRDEKSLLPPSAAPLAPKKPSAKPQPKIESLLPEPATSEPMVDEPAVDEAAADLPAPTTPGELPGELPVESSADAPQRESSPTPSPTPKPRSAAAQNKADKLLPPRAAIDDLLPPGDPDAEPEPTSEPEADVAAKSGRKPESLLPDGAAEVDPGAVQQIALPEKEMAEAERPKIPLRGPDGSIIIPTEDGRYTALHEPVKTVGEGLNERELVRLPPEVRQRRRRKRNIIVYIICIIALLALFGWLAR